MVLPAELLQVSYAGQLRSSFTDRFSQIDVVACNELFFQRAEQEVVLLLADGALADATTNNVSTVAMTETATVSDIVARCPADLIKRALPKSIQHKKEKWLKYFLTEREIDFMRELRSSGVVKPLSAHADVDVGVVTGKNDFFVLSGEQVGSLGLEGHTVPLVSRSFQLRGARIDKSDWRKLSASGDRVHLLNIPATSLGNLTGFAPSVHTIGGEQRSSQRIQVLDTQTFVGTLCRRSGRRMLLCSDKSTTFHALFKMQPRLLQRIPFIECG